MRSLGRASSNGGGVTRRDGRTKDIVRQLAAVLAARSDQHAAEANPAPGGNPVPHAACVISTGWDAIDRALTPASPRAIDSDALAHVGRGGLQRGVVHEWLGHEEPTTLRRRWLPPHSLFIHLAWRAIEADAEASGVVVWIGRRVWPQARALKRFTTEITENTERAFWILDFGFWKGKTLSRRQPTLPSRRLGFDSNAFTYSSVSSVVNLAEIQNPKSQIQNALLSRSLFIDPPDDASRLWAIDLALRSPAASVVIADGSKLKMAESRRLQLAAERSRTLALFARPAWESTELSAAATRWRIARTPSPSAAPRWIVELVRCKHGGALQGSKTSGAGSGTCGGHGGRMGGWEIEYASPGHLRLVADVVDRSGSPREAEERLSTLSLA